MSSCLYNRFRCTIVSSIIIPNDELKGACVRNGWHYENTGFNLKDMSFTVTIKGASKKSIFVHLIGFLYSSYNYVVIKKKDRLVINFTLNKGYPLISFDEEFVNYFWRCIPQTVQDFCRKDGLLIDHTINQVVDKVIKSRKKDPSFLIFREYAKLVRGYLQSNKEDIRVIGCVDIKQI